MIIKYTTDIEIVKNSQRELYLKKVGSIKELFEDILNVGVDYGVVDDDIISHIVKNHKNNNFKTDITLGEKVHILLPQYNELIFSTPHKDYANCQNDIYYIIFEKDNEILDYDFFKTDGLISAELYFLNKFKDNDKFFKKFYASIFGINITNFPQEFAVLHRDKSKLVDVCDIFKINRKHLQSLFVRGDNYKAAFDLLKRIDVEFLSDYYESEMSGKDESGLPVRDMEKFKATKEFFVEYLDGKQAKFTKSDGTPHLSKISKFLNINFETLKNYIEILNKKDEFNIPTVASNGGAPINIENFEIVKKEYNRIIKDNDIEFLKKNGDINVKKLAKHLNINYATVLSYIKNIDLEKDGDI